MARKWILLFVLSLGTALALAQGWAPHDPIYIFGDEDFTWENGVIGAPAPPMTRTSSKAG